MDDVVRESDGGRYRLWVQAVLGLLVLGVFILVSVGGAVTSYDAGMDVPDWPGTFGHQMFVAPLDVWFKDEATGEFFHGAFWEHSHRLVGSLVGVLAIVAAVALVRTQRRRPWLGWLGLGLLGLIVVQGLLGGLRVSEANVVLAGVHGVLGQLVLAGCVVGFLAVGRRWVGSAEAVTTGQASQSARRGPQRWEMWVLGGLVGVALSPMFLAGRNAEGLINWGYGRVLAVCGPAVGLYVAWCVWGMVRSRSSRWGSLRWGKARWGKAGLGNPRSQSVGFGRVGVLAWVVLGAVLVQLVLGASVRHAKADRSIPDAPLSYGSVVPPMTGAGLNEALLDVPPTLGVKRATLGMVWLNYSHRVGAVLVTTLVLGLAVSVMASGLGRRPEVFGPVVGLVGLVGVQVMLGLMTVWSETYPTFATVHQATGALLMSLTVVVVCRVWLAGREVGVEGVRSVREVGGGGGEGGGRGGGGDPRLQTVGFGGGGGS